MTSVNSEKKILLFRHDSWIGAPYLTALMDDIGIPYAFIKVDKGCAVPSALGDDVAGLVFLGGTMSANDSLPWIKAELQLINQAYRQKRPVLGHGLGSQLISKALGGEVTAMHRKEIGWHPIQFLDTQAALEWKGNIPDSMKILLWHHDEFTLPQGAQPLYVTPHCKNQAFAIDNIIATMAHIELTGAMLENWLEIYGADIAPDGRSVQSIKQIKDGMQSKMQEMHVLSDTFYLKWLKLAYPENAHANLHHRLRFYLKFGACLCGQVQFNLKNARAVVNCHCEECRKFHGNFAAYTKVQMTDIYISGRENIRWYQVKKGHAKRGFCRRCGSSLFWRREADSGICVSASALAVPTKLETTKNIYTDDASDFYALDGGLENYPATMEKNR